MESQYKKKQVGDLREHDSQFNVVLLFHSPMKDRNRHPVPAGVTGQNYSWALLNFHGVDK